jgi:hypothetical protein
LMIIRGSMSSGHHQILGTKYGSGNHCIPILCESLPLKTHTAYHGLGAQMIAHLTKVEMDVSTILSHCKTLLLIQTALIAQITCPRSSGLDVSMVNAISLLLGPSPDVSSHWSSVF